MEAALIARLLASAGVAALVQDRIHWVRRPQGSALPCIVLHRVGGLPDYHLAGDSGMVETRVQADCLGATFGEALALAEALKRDVTGQRFVQGPTRFSSVLVAGERDDSFYDAPDAHVRVAVDLLIQHGEA